MTDSTTGLRNVQLEAKTEGLGFETIILQGRGKTVGPDIRPLSDYYLDDDDWSKHGKSLKKKSLVLRNGKLDPKNRKI